MLVVRKPSTYIIGVNEIVTSKIPQYSKFLYYIHQTLLSSYWDLAEGLGTRVSQASTYSTVFNSLYTRNLASFPGPAQLSVACSMESWVGHENNATRSS